MNTPAIKTTANTKNRVTLPRWTVSPIFLLLLVGLVVCCFLPIAIWGSQGGLIAGWFAIIGFALLYEYLAVAMFVIVFGICCSVGYDLPPPKENATNPVEIWGFMGAGLVSVAIVLASIIVWIRESTPLGFSRLLQDLISQGDSTSELRASQFSLFRLLAVISMTCVVLALFNMSANIGVVLAPPVLLTGYLLMNRKIGFALIVSLSIPLLCRLFLAG